MNVSSSRIMSSEYACPRKPACGGSDRAAGRDGSERSRRVGRREPRLAHSESPPTFSRDGCCHTDLRARGLLRAACLGFLVKNYAEDASFSSNTVVPTAPIHSCRSSWPTRWVGAAQCRSSASCAGLVFDWRDQIWAILPSTQIC